MSWRRGSATFWTLLTSREPYLKTVQRNFWKIISWTEEEEHEDFIDLDIIFFFKYRNREFKEMLDITVEVSSIIRKHLIPSATENSKSFFYSEKENYYRKSVEIPIANNLKEVRQ